MENSTIVICIIAALIVLLLSFTLLKGVVRMLILAIAVIAAVATWMFMQRSGFTLFSMVGISPPTWLIQILAILMALGVFIILFHGMRWFADLFSLRGKKKAGPIAIITMLFMTLLMLWVASLGLSYAGDIARIAHYHDRATAQMTGEPAPAEPLLFCIKKNMRQAPATAWLSSLDPMEDTALTNLACLIPFGCPLGEQEYTQFYDTALSRSGIPHAGRFKKLFADPGLRKLVEDKRFVTLLENEQLKSFLHLGNSEEVLYNSFKPYK